MAPTVDPDPDLRFADSNAGDVLRATADKALAEAEGIDGHIAALNDSGKGDRITAATARLLARRDHLKREAKAAIAGAHLHTALRDAAAWYRSVAPTAEAITGAWEAWQAARARWIAASGPERPKARAESVAAQNHYNELVKLRERAIAQYKTRATEATAAYEAEVPELGGESVIKPPAGAGTPTTPAPSTPAAPAAAALSPSDDALAPLRAPAPETALAPAPADTAPPAEISPTTTVSGATPDQAAEIAKLLTQPQVQPVAMPMQQQPQMAAAGAPVLSQPAQQRRAEDPFANANANEPIDLAALAALPLSRPTASAPAIASPTPALAPVSIVTPTPDPVYSGINLGGTPGLNPVAPLAQPTNADGGTGKSYENLPANGNMTGRADGAPANSAFTKLAGAAAEQVRANPTGTGTAPTNGIGAGGVPFVPGVNGPGVNGSGNGNGKGVKAGSNNDDYNELTAAQTIAEAVPGGTIAQNRDDDDDRK